MLQRQLREIQQELARTRKQTERVEAKVEAAPARYSAPPPMATKGPLPPPPPERVKVTLGGFIAAETVWRQHNMVNDIGTAFATTPYPFSPLYNEHEFHGTARQSRISLLVEGNIDPYQKLRVLRVGLPGRRQHVELQPEQQLGSALATRLFHL
jgi:hypothetical protein